MMKTKDKKIILRMKKETKRAIAHVESLEKLYLAMIKKKNK